jgi:hypothetical protein
LPTLAIAAQSPVKPLGPTTAISKFDVERRAVRREANAVLRKIKKLDAELERRMPKPHPSITHSAENDADGLQHYPPDREPHTLHRYISSQTIEGKIRQIEQPGAAIESKSELARGRPNARPACSAQLGWRSLGAGGCFTGRRP